MENKSTRIPPVNVTPLVDVLLILVIVLLLAMPLYVKRLTVALPETSLTGSPTPVKALAIALKPDATVYVQEIQAPLPEVLARVNSTVTVELSVDKATSYETVAQVLAQLKNKNPKEIVLLTR